MELKDYQEGVLETFDLYLDSLVSKRLNTLELEQLSIDRPEIDIPIPDFTLEAWNEMAKKGALPKARQNIPFSHREDGTGRPVPSVTFKIPTGGGKTLLATHSVSRILSKWVQSNHGFVLWIVPNESIYAQTYKALSNREHPYRQILDRAAAGRVKILEKNSPLHRRDVEESLCVMILMLQSSNRENKDSLKIFKDSGSVRGFFPAEDDFQAHSQLLEQIPNLDTYGDKSTLGCVIKDSLGNALRFTRPIVIMDEGHKAFSRLAIDTLYGFNPSFVLELSATPADRPNDAPPMFSNWLVDIRGTALDQEEMIKLPINVTVRGDDDWQDCLRASFEHLNILQSVSDKFHAESSRYIRPICLVQVERTGRDQREAGFIHAEDAKEYLLRLGVKEQQIAIKTSEKNELKQPENLDLLSSTNQVRFIITKQALQEGWDCSFAYVLCSLAPGSSRKAMTQLIGRILRQPDAQKTGVSDLDECYVFCFHVSTKDVVDGIKEGLEKDGMADLVDHIQADSGSGKGTTELGRSLNRRERFKKPSIFLPIVNWVHDGKVRPLDYEQDILHRIDWSSISVDGLANSIPDTTHGHETKIVKLGLQDRGSKDFLKAEKIDSNQITEEFDALHVVRAITDIVPNPWIAREYVSTVLSELEKRGIIAEKLGRLGALILETLRSHLLKQRDEIAEKLFLLDVKGGRVQFRLRSDGNNWVMPKTLPTQRATNSQELRRPDGEIVKNSLFEPAYRDDFNNYEQNVACYLDSEEAMRWWHRNVAQQQYAIQGWKKNKVYPDFVFTMETDEGKTKLHILETKGDHLDNSDTEYKQRLLEICSDIYRFENVIKAGDLELVIDEDTTVECSLIFEQKWKTDLSKLLD